jgi:tetratricopeptide (TPR) repeat protein
MHEYRYRAFLCYSHRDSAWAEWLHHALETFPIPPRLVGIETGAGVIPRKLAPVFRDRDELPSAANLSAKVSDALAQSANLVVICSPHSAQSHWVDEEVRTFQRLGRGDRIFCLIVDGEPGASRWAGREHDECMPAALTHRIDAAGGDTDERLEPIAADARPGMDGRVDARTKLVAGLLGVDLDDLKHRERRRRRWKATVAIAVAFVLLCLTTTLAVDAVIARHAAERRQEQAEELVGFMLGDLDDKLREVNRLDILESVATRVVKYFATMPAADQTAEILALRARAELKLGAVRRDQGHVDDSLVNFNDALAASNTLLKKDAANTGYALINAEALSWIGFVDWSQGRLDDALKRFSKARDVLMLARAQNADDTDLLDRLGSVRTNIGRVFEAKNQFPGAHEEYSSVLETYSYLTRREPEKAAWRTELGYAHNNLAQLSMKSGNLEDALAQYLADRDIKQTLLDLDPSSNARREDLIASQAFLGKVFLSCGQTSSALVNLHSAMEGIETLLRIDPNSTDWIEKAGGYGWIYGQALRANGDIAAAEDADAKAISRLAELVRKDPSTVGWQRKLAQAQLENAKRLLVETRFSAAGIAAGAASESLRKVKASPEDAAAQNLAAQIKLVLGDSAHAQGETERAQSFWKEAAASLGPAATDSKDPILVDTRIRVLLRIGSSETAIPELWELADTGYRDPDLMKDLKKFEVEPPVSAAADRIAKVASANAAQSSNAYRN